MKKFTFMLLAAFIAVAAVAQKPMVKGKQFPFTKEIQQLKGVQRTLKAQSSTRKKAAEDLVTPPETASVQSFYTTGGTFYAYNEGWVDITSDMATVNVAIDGSDIYMQGVAYWFKDNWVKGTIDGETVTFPCQLIGTDEYGDEFMVGSADGQTATDFVFNFDSENGVLTATTGYWFESGYIDAVSPYCYWYQPVFGLTEPEGPTLVTLPEGVEAEEYTMFYVDDEDASSAINVNVAVDGNDVYVQGFSSYIPEAWVKGTKEGNTVTFPAKQYVGEYSGYTSYAFYNGNAVFTYDESADTYTAEGEIYGVLGNRYYDGYYVNPVIKKVTETVAMPANPGITGLENSQYGYIVTFNVPVVGTEGEDLVTSKLSYIIYTDVEGEVSPLTFTPETHSRLTESMTEIPYGFTESYDFYPSYIYLNDLYSESWNKIGIQSIYVGGGEVNATEIQWFEIKPYAKTTFDFNTMNVATSSNVTTDGDITEVLELTEGVVVLAISPKTESATTQNRFWSTGNGPQLRVYSGTLTFSVPELYTITKIEFNAAKWNEGNTADSGEFDGTTWTGEAQTVVVSIAANTQINSIALSVNKGEVTPVEAPEDLVTETYMLDAMARVAEYDQEGGGYYLGEATEYNAQLEVGFYEDKLYISGFSGDFPDFWVKATRNSEGLYVIPANQLMGTYEFFGYSFSYYFAATDEDGNLLDAVLNVDEETKTITSAQTLVLNGAEDKFDPYMTYEDVVITKMVEVAATPADPEITKLTLTDTNYPKIEFNIPLVDTENNGMLSSKLYYVLWIYKFAEEKQLTLTTDLYEKLDEDMTEIPYNFSDDWDVYNNMVYLNQSEEEMKTWKMIGLQSIYYGSDERHESNIVWVENPIYDENATGIASIIENGKDAVIYNIAGQRVQKAQKGLYIVNGKKVVVK